MRSRLNQTIPPSWILRFGLATLIVLLLLPAAYSALTYDETTLQPGTIEEPADNYTAISAQGFHFAGHGNIKKPARLVYVDEYGETEWVYNGTERGARWFYDVDPLPDGNLLVVSTKPDETVVFALDPETQERVWEERFALRDTHDVSRISDDELVVAAMREWDEANGTSNDRIFIYNRTTEEITWEWYFKDHFPEDMDGGHDSDWTHVNKVGVIDDHRLIVSPRNFDQAIVINRTTNEIEKQLGEDGNYDILYEQHSPDYLESDDGTPTILVADSENDRILEYALVDACEYPGEGVRGNAVDCEWELVWELGGPGELNWPRDATRLPNGNTLVTDTLNHRIIEVTPEGEVVWEYYATWGPYDAERIGTGPESEGPTMQDQNISGSYSITGSAGLNPETDDRHEFAEWLILQSAGTAVEDEVTRFAQRWAHITPWIRPVWMTGWDFMGFIVASLLLLGWSVGEVLAQRRSIIAKIMHEV